MKIASTLGKTLANHSEKRSELPQSTAYHAYRFPPLLRGMGQSDSNDALLMEEPDELQRGYQDGLQQGQQQGYQTGFQQGILDGQQQGMEQGLTEGRAQGRVEIQQQLQSALALSEALHQELSQSCHQQVRQHSEYLCQLIHQVARQVIQAELSLQPDQILRMVEATLAELPEQSEDVCVYLHSHDHQCLQELATEQLTPWHIEIDDTLSRGSCRVVTQDSEAFADSERRLSQCMTHVRESLLPDA